MEKFISSCEREYEREFFSFPPSSRYPLRGCLSLIYRRVCTAVLDRRLHTTHLLLLFLTAGNVVEGVRVGVHVGTAAEMLLCVCLNRWPVRIKHIKPYLSLH